MLKFRLPVTPVSLTPLVAVLPLVLMCTLRPPPAELAIILFSSLVNPVVRLVLLQVVPL